MSSASRTAHSAHSWFTLYSSSVKRNYGDFARGPGINTKIDTLQRTSHKIFVLPNILRDMSRSYRFSQYDDSIHISFYFRRNAISRRAIEWHVNERSDRNDKIRHSFTRIHNSTATNTQNDVNVMIHCCASPFKTCLAIICAALRLFTLGERSHSQASACLYWYALRWVRTVGIRLK